MSKAIAKPLRRLASDQVQLHKAGLPPNYLFPPAGSDSLSDLTTLSVFLAGPDNTPYASGVFKLELRMESLYPLVPPTAYFRTKIFHPNVDPSTGAVCVDTLKRDWKQELTLRDVLVTISCLLVCPNPASALNAEAGQLMDEDFASFERRAALWARMHAAVSPTLVEAVAEAKCRVVGEKELAAPRTRGKKRREMADELPVLGMDSQSQNTPAARNERKTSKIQSTTATTLSGTLFGGMPQERKAIGLGLDIDMDSTTAMDLDIPNQSTPRRPQRKCQSTMMPPPTKTCPRRKESPLASFPSTPCPEGVSDFSPPPAKKRRTHSHVPQFPRSEIPTMSSMDNGLTLESQEPESDAFGASFATPWLNWQQHLPVKSQEQLEIESVLRQAAGYDIERYNRGDFGPRRGIFRL